jgi:hypothetical protein
MARSEAVDGGIMGNERIMFRERNSLNLLGRQNSIYI